LSHFNSVGVNFGRYKLVKFYEKFRNNYIENLKRIPDIRSLYLPIQPAIKQPAEGVVYHEFLPDPRLQGFIYCYWQLKTQYPLREAFHYRVVADGCMDIYFELQNAQHSFIMGFSNSYTEFPLDQAFDYVGIRFLPAMFPQLYKINAAELTNRYGALHEVVPSVSKFLQESMTEHLSMHSIKTILDTHFLTHLSKTTIQVDSRLNESIDLILQTACAISIEKDLQQGISVRQLRRLFEFYMGDTPKEFSKIVRFQKILHEPNVQKNKMYLDAGYYDQAHFIKEFKSLYGLTPGKVFEK
jgi:AraC-like DNA-binding protein